MASSCAVLDDQLYDDGDDEKSLATSSGPTMGPRGVRSKDKRGELKHKRWQELNQVADRIQGGDSET